MSETSVSDFVLGIALASTGGAAVVSLGAAGFVLWSDGDPLLMAGSGVTTFFNAALAGFSYGGWTKDTTESKPSD